MGKSLASMEALLDRRLAGELLKLGFKSEAPLVFQRDYPEVSQFLRFPTRLQKDVMLFNANAAVRLAEVERVLGNEDSLLPTLMMPVHLLRRSREYREWRFTAVSPQSLVDEVLVDCTELLVPFLEKMSSIETTKLQLIYEIDRFAAGNEADDQSSYDAESKKASMKMGNWTLVLNPQQRIEKLAAIYVVEGNLVAAERLIDGEIVKLSSGNETPPRKAMRLRMEMLKRRLVG